MNIINITFFVIIIICLLLSCLYFFCSQTTNENFSSDIVSTKDIVDTMITSGHKIDTAKEKIKDTKDSSDDNTQDIQDTYDTQDIQDTQDTQDTYDTQDCRCPCKKKWCSELCPMVAGQDPLGYWHPPRTDWSNFYFKTY